MPLAVAAAGWDNALVSSPLVVTDLCSLDMHKSAILRAVFEMLEDSVNFWIDGAGDTILRACYSDTGKTGFRVDSWDTHLDVAGR